MPLKKNIPPIQKKIDRLNQQGFELRVHDFSRSLKNGEEALRLSRKAGYRAGEAIALRTVGFCYVRLAKYKEAKPLLERALAMLESMHDIPGQSLAYQYLCIIERSWGNFGKALELGFRSVGLSEQANSPDLTAENRYQVGITYKLLGQFEKALEYLFQASAYYEETNNPTFRSYPIQGIGSIYFENGNFRKALEFFKQALKYRQQAEDKLGAAGSFDSLGFTYFKLKEYKKAIAHGTQSLAISRITKDARAQANAMAHLAEVYKATRDISRAVSLSEQSMQLRKKAGDKRGETELLLFQAGLYTRDKNPANQEQVPALLAKAIALADHIKATDLQSRIHYQLYQWHQGRKEFEKALQHLSTHAALEKQHQQDTINQKMQNLEIAYNAEQLRKETNAVKDRNEELTKLNRELEIESALERVRTVAMGMKNPADMLDICKIISQQLTLLGMKGIRNVQTAIFYYDRGVYMNYQYYAKHDRTFITETDYTDHKVPRDFAAQMKKGKGQYHITHIRGRAKLMQWVRYQRGTNVFVDPYILRSDYLGYYWFSLGPVAMGISSYQALSAEEMELFKKFRNVFDLAYRRYLDIERAEAQAREARIEAALERVRARSMAMQSSEELADLVAVVFNELTRLGFPLSSSIIWIHDHTGAKNTLWIASAEMNKPPHAFEITPFHKGFFSSIIKAWKSRDPRWTYPLSGPAKKLFESAFYKSLPGLPAAFRHALSRPKHVLFSASFNNFGALEIVSTRPLNEEMYSVLHRFGRVFDLSYTRFNDLKIAEAQAREGQVQLALERVRARTMAMQQSGELKEVSYVLFEQLRNLGEIAEQLSIAIFNESRQQMELSVTLAGNRLPQTYEIPFDEPFLMGKAYRAAKAGKSSFIHILTGTELAAYNRYRNRVFGGRLSKEEKKHTKRIVHFAFFSKGLISYSSHEERPAEAILLLERFAAVFDGTYTRFLDLQKAEAQARESQIQLALERIRARTMAMQQSSELPEAASLLFQQVQSLGMPAWSAGYCIWSDDKKAATLWMSSEGVLQPPFTAPTTEDELFIEMRKGHESGKDLHVVEMGGPKLEAHYKYMRTLPVVGEIFDAILEAGHPLPGFQVMHYAYFSKGYLLFITYQPVPEAHEIFKRFASVFDQTYTRFLDLQKAEAQAREAQIETALERVRARALAMHSSDEFMEVAKVLREQMVILGQRELETSAVHLYEEDPAYILSWRAFRLSTDQKGKITYGFFKIPKGSCELASEFIQKFKSKAIDYTLEVSGAKQKEWYKLLFQLAPEVKAAMEKTGTTREIRYYHLSKFSGGALLMVSSKKPAVEIIELQKRAALVFDLAYRRFKDLQKAEAQAREAQVQLALERVRARTMAMHHSDELKETTHILFEQMKELGEPVDQLTIGIVNEENRVIEISATVLGDTLKQIYSHSIDEPYMMAKVYKAWKKKQKTVVVALKGDELNAYNRYRNELTNSNRFPTDLGKEDQRIVYAAFFSKGMLAIGAHETRPEASLQLLIKFASVFDLTYTRFIDLQKAEAQAREAQIEAALERVRSRSLGMQKSEELKTVIKVVYEQLILLGIRLDHAGFVVDYQPGGDWHFWIADEQAIPSKITHPYFESTWATQFIHAKEKGIERFETRLDFDEKNEFYQQLLSYVPGLPDETKAFYLSCPGLAATTLLFKDVSLYIENFEGIPYSEEDNRIFQRFGKVFEQSYTRFLDLQKAEAQAREAQIEAALERVRSKTMAMHNSKEVGESVAMLFDEMAGLGLLTAADRCGIGIMQPDHIMELWTAEKTDGKTEMTIGYLDMIPHPLLQQVYQNWINKKETFQYILEGEDKDNYYKALRQQTRYRIRRDYYSGLNRIFHTDFFFKEGCLYVFSQHAFSPDSVAISLRFANLFGQTYRRYLDLQKAEAQAREAQIEAALEKVRSRTMAMQTSNELQETAALLFQEFRKLGTDEIFQVTIGTYDETTQLIDFRVTNWAGSGGQENRKFQLDMREPYLLKQVIHAWKSAEKSLVIELSGEQLEGWLRYRNKMSGVTVSSADTGGKRVITCAFYSNGHLSMSTAEPVSPETVRILERFAAVFDVTYTRFQDLQRAEAQAREARIEAALERVRSRTLAMQKSDELAETAAVLFQQLISLGIEPNRLYIILIQEGNPAMEAWVTDEDGSKVSMGFTGNYEKNQSLYKMYQGWKAGQASLVIDMQGEELQQYFHYLHDELHVPFKGGLEQKRRLQHIAYFSHGLIGMASPDEQPAETIQLLERFAAVFNLTFTRFNDLKIAEAHAEQAEKDLIAIKESKQKAEEALAELQVTQKQLIQSEKMASLGELTAGIAHEIQNPLNFVNNFSEVSNELLQEMLEEIGKANFEEVKAIADDVRQNLEKINHHGKRADGIVKGMLQHSRAGSGQKEPTDINVLCDEYLRLAFHGLRAKDKSFNAKFETEFDNRIGKINIMPQDMGRVILNLINNAFYAVTERKKKSEPGFDPTVSISTRQENGVLEITVKDNGMGIPQQVLDKIFQPFFTTKPTGQGTGLGLSLSYDIVKAHGGVLQVETIEGKGTVFQIILPAIS